MKSLLPSGEGVSGRTRINNAFPGERVVARIEHVGKHTTFANTESVEREHPGRRVPLCARHCDVIGGRCTGCALMALDEDAQREVLAQMLSSQHGLEVDEVIAAPEALGYRWSAKRIASVSYTHLRAHETNDLISYAVFSL